MPARLSNQRPQPSARHDEKDVLWCYRTNPPHAFISTHYHCTALLLLIPSHRPPQHAFVPSLLGLHARLRRPFWLASAARPGAR